MTSLLALFANNILPIFLAAGSGYLLSKYLKIHPRPVSQVAFYIFSPCLIFKLLTSYQFETEEVISIAGITTATVLGVGLLTLFIGRFLNLERKLLSAVLITAMFGNAGNFGLSLNLFAFGEEALAYASLYFVTLAILVYTVGVIIASMGTSSLGDALRGLLKVPAIYAAVLAILTIAAGWRIPVPVGRTVTILGDAAIPMLMVLLGIQLQHARWDGQIRALGLTNLMRLIGGPALAFGLSLAIGLQGPANQATIAESATPTAVVMTVLATEFNIEPTFVTTAVFTSTLLSPLTVTPILALLGA